MSEIKKAWTFDEVKRHAEKALQKDADELAEMANQAPARPGQGVTEVVRDFFDDEPAVNIDDPE